MDKLLPLFLAYLRFYRQPVNRRKARQFLNARLRRRDGVIFLARVRGVTSGFCQLYPAFDSLRQARTWILHDLFVAPEVRRQGVGERLLRHTQAFARRSGAQGLTLDTAATNRPAQRLYKKWGWRRDSKFFRFQFEIG